jgi:hypothetical protein
MTKNTKRRSNSEIARDRRKIAELYLQGWIQADIAKELGVVQSTISRDLASLHKEWLQAAIVDFDTAKAQEVAKIDHLERIYYRAWERSCEDAETVRQEGDPKDEKGQPDKVVHTRKGQAGDPRFLQGVQWCIERRCKILGIEAPTKLEHSGSLETKLLVIPPKDE